MAFSPISLVPIQYQNPADNTPASGFVIKLFAAGGSTNILMATDSTGDTTFTDVQLNSDGYPEFNGSEVIPYIDQSYKFRMYETQADADADLNAVRTFDNLSPSSITGEFSIEDAVNAAVTDVLSLTHTSSLAPGVGIGTGIKFIAETAADNNEIGMRLHAVSTNVGAGTENFDCVILLMASGAAAAEKWRVASDGTVTTTGTTEATSATASANKHPGGISTAKKLWAGDDIITDATFLPLGDVSAGDVAAIGHDTTHGLKVTGQGSVNDFNWFNDALSSVLRCPTGAVNLIGAGAYTAAGVITGLTLEATGAVSASDNAAIGFSSANGLEGTGQGSVNDFNWFNDAKASVIRCPTGTVNPVFAGTPDFSAAGIVFDDEILDEYDEGTFSPDLSDGTNSDATLGAVYGRYTRIGNLVRINIRMVTSALNSVSGALRIINLPFTSDSTSGVKHSITCSRAAGLAITASMNLGGDVEEGVTYMLITLWDATTGTTQITDTEWSADGDAFFTGTYEV